jgi:mono/diheme cytochrome c family protein
MTGRAALAAVSCVMMAAAAAALVRAADDPGRRVYEAHCAKCHGMDAKGRGRIAPSLVPFELSYDAALELIRHPVCEMPPVPASEVGDEEVAQIVRYLKSLK